MFVPKLDLVIQFVLALLLCNSTLSNAQNFSILNTPAIPPLTNAKVQWADFNNDNVLDLFVAGLTNGGTLHTSVYINNTGGAFSLINLTPLGDIAFAFGDFNRDGFIDIITSGVNSGGEKKTIVYRNNNGGSFIPENIQLANLSRGGLLWRDLDHDGDLDILISGLNQANATQLFLYKNQEGVYESVPHSIVAVSNGQFKSFDVNNDGNMEVLVTGLSSDGVPVSKVYTFDKDINIQEYGNPLIGTAFNSVSIGDVNNDGFSDIIVAGLANEALEKNTLLWQNNGTGFTSLTTTLTPLSAPSVTIADINNDGLSDLLLTGQDNATPVEYKQFKYYIGDGSFGFTDFGHSLNNIINGDVTVGDFDNDGDLDVFQSGQSEISLVSSLFLSDQSATVVNNLPTTPSSLESIVNGEDVLLHWDAASDDHTPTAALTYNIYLSRDENGSDLIVAPLSNLTTGFRRVPAMGNVGHSTQTSIKGLPAGRYYWSVQSIDNGYRGSPFSTEQTFSICDPVSLGADTTLCFGEDLVLQMGDLGDQVNWYEAGIGLLFGNINTLTYTVESDQRLVVEVIKPYGCTVKDTIQVFVSMPPAIDLGPDDALCFGETFEMELSHAYDSVNWASMEGFLLKNSFSYSYQVTTKDTLVAQVFNSLKCMSTDTIVVDVFSLPHFTIGDDQEICEGEEVSFMVAGTWEDVQWKTLSGNINPLSSTTYSFHVITDESVIAMVKDANGCVNRDTSTVVKLALPEIDIGSDIEVCFGEQAELEASTGTYTVNWYDDASNLLLPNQFLFSQTILSTVSRVAQAIAPNGCVNYDTVRIEMLPLPQYDLGADTAVCYGNNILLDAGITFTEVNWILKKSGDIVKADSWFYDHYVSETDTVIVFFKDQKGCVNYDSISIEMIQLPNFSLGNDRFICENEQADFSIPGDWEEVNWYTVNNIMLAGNTSVFTSVVTESFPLIAQVINDRGCIHYDTMMVNRLALPQFELGPDLRYCFGDEFSLTTSLSQVDYQWMDVSGNVLATSSTYTSLAESSRKIILEVINNTGCHWKDSLHIFVDPLPVFSIEGAQEICKGSSVPLSVDFPTEAIVWMTGTDTIATDISQIILKPSVSAMVEAIVTDINGCIDSRSHAVTVNDLPVANAGADSLLCYGEWMILGEGEDEGFTYSWSPALYLSSTNTLHPVATPQSTITYVLKVIDNNGCEMTDHVYIEVNPEIVVDAGSNTAICIGESIQLGGAPTASGSRFEYQYEWLARHNTFGSSEANPVITPAETDIYDLLVTTGRCSVEYDSIEVIVHELPTIEAIGTQSIGAGSSVQLFASGGINYTWSPAESLNDHAVSNPLATPTKTTTYTVVGVDANGCANEAETTVLVQNSLFIPSLFTPNNDGKNDRFRIFGSGIASITFSIFDEHGNRLFYANTVEKAFGEGWDGTSNSVTLGSGTYIWKIEGKFFNGEPLLFQGQKSGFIKLLR